jgi:hypothetical protein
MELPEIPATEPIIRVAENAAAEVRSLLAQPENAGRTLRLRKIL